MFTKIDFQMSPEKIRLNSGNGSVNEPGLMQARRAGGGLTFQQKLVAVLVGEARVGAPRHFVRRLEELNAVGLHPLVRSVDIVALEHDRRLHRLPALHHGARVMVIMRAQLLSIQ